MQDGSGGHQVSGGRRRWRTGHLVAVAMASAVLATMISVPAGVWASQRFSDVPDNHPFGDDIDWMADTGISTGYDDGTFKPDTAVSRQAMAAFMRRAFDLRDPIDTHRYELGFRFTDDEWSTPPVPTHVTVVVPPGTTAHLTATFNAEGRCVTSVCHGAIALNGTRVKSAQHCRDCYFEPFTLVYASAQPVGPGTYTFTLEGSRDHPYGAEPDWRLTNVDFVAEAHLLPS